MHTLSPSSLSDGNQVNSTYSGSQSPTEFSSNLIGGRRRSRRTYKRFMRGRKNYKKSVRRSPGIMSRLMRGFSKRRR